MKKNFYGFLPTSAQAATTAATGTTFCRKTAVSPVTSSTRSRASTRIARGFPPTKASPTTTARTGLSIVPRSIPTSPKCWYATRPASSKRFQSRPPRHTTTYSASTSRLARVIFRVLAQVPMGPCLEDFLGQLDQVFVFEHSDLILEFLLNVGHRRGTAPKVGPESYASVADVEALAPTRKLGQGSNPSKA